MRNYRSQRFDSLFPLYVLTSTGFFVTTLFTTFVIKEKNPFSLIVSLMAILMIIIWAFVRRTSFKRYSSLVLVFFTIKVTSVIVLAYLNVLPSYLTDKLDSNRLILTVITYYICATGIGSYDFKVNLFI